MTQITMKVDSQRRRHGQYTQRSYANAMSSEDECTIMSPLATGRTGEVDDIHGVASGNKHPPGMNMMPRTVGSVPSKKLTTQVTM